MMAYDNGVDDDFGLLRINGCSNSIMANHISETIGRQYLKPAGVKPVIIHIEAGHGNYVANNHIVATTEAADKSGLNGDDSCFGAQVGALLTVDSLEELDVVAVRVAAEAVNNTILDTCSETQCEVDTTRNKCRFV